MTNREANATNPPASDVGAQDVHIATSDGLSLAARLWASDDQAAPKMVAIVNSGAGIVSRYYDNFAKFLAESGFPTITYDYRGIGRCRPTSLRGFEASVEQWGSKDCAAVLDWMAARYPAARRILIGHSVGGFLTGFAKNGHLIDYMLLVGAHTGYWRDYSRQTRPAMYLLWHVLMPLLTSIFGFFPGRYLRLLEDLPAGVAYQWAARRRPDFWWNLKLPDGSPNLELIRDLVSRFQSIRAKTLIVEISDDPFATACATNRIAGLFSNCSIRRYQVRPVDVGASNIGHFGYFRSRFRETLWPDAVEWLRDISQ